jgi:hypothetical protein
MYLHLTNPRYLLLNIQYQTHLHHIFPNYLIHMMCVTTGREITIKDYESILNQSGRKHNQTRCPKSNVIGVIECTKAR